MNGDVTPWIPLLIGAAAAGTALALRLATLVRGRAERSRFVDDDVLAQLLPMPSRGLGTVRAALFAAGVGTLGAAAAGLSSGAPAGGPPSSSGIQTVLVLDASNSMLAEDAEPNRLELQRELARELAVHLPGPVGVVYFAGAGYVLTPLTGDLGAVLMFVDAVRPRSVGQGGSATGAGLHQALNVLAGGDPGTRREVVFFSDGEETIDGGRDEALERAIRAGVRVHAVGIGTEEGGPIPLGPDVAAAGALEGGREGGDRDEVDADGLRAREMGHLRDVEGEVVVTRLEAALLREMAEATGGTYVPGTAEGIDTLVAQIGAERSRGLLGAGAARALLLAAFFLLWADAFLFRRA